MRLFFIKKVNILNWYLPGDVSVLRTIFCRGTLRCLIYSIDNDILMIILYSSATTIICTVQRRRVCNASKIYLSFRFRCRSLVRRYGVREIGQTPERVAELSWRELLHEYARAEFVDVARTHYVLLSDRQRNGLLVVERGTLNLLPIIYTLYIHI